MDRDDKRHIYEMLDELSLEEFDEPEIPMDEVAKARVKNNVKKQLKRSKRSRRKIIISAAIVLIAVCAAISPKGMEVMAFIREKLFFTPGIGIVNTDKESYVLQKPQSLKNGSEDVLVKTVISQDGELDVGIWISNFSYENMSKDEFMNMEDEDMKIRLSDGTVISSDSGVRAGGGASCFVNKRFPTDGIVKEFTLIFNGCEEEIRLIKSQEFNNYDEVGGNSSYKDMMIGANKYEYGGNTYISFWCSEDAVNSRRYNMLLSKDDIKVSGAESGKSYIIEHSPTDGQSREFYINGIIDEPLNVELSRVSLDYSLEKPFEVKLSIPKKGETVEIGKEADLEEIGEKILLKSITRTDKGIEVEADTGKFKKDDSFIEIFSMGRIGWAEGTALDSSHGDMKVLSGVDYEDLSLSEKITGSFKFTISDVSIIKYGNWKFNVK